MTINVFNVFQDLVNMDNAQPCNQHYDWRTHEAVARDILGRFFHRCCGKIEFSHGAAWEVYSYRTVVLKYKKYKQLDDSSSCCIRLSRFEEMYKEEEEKFKASQEY
jgi:hypothetical protein